MVEPEQDCRLCQRLAAFRDINREREPTWHNAPVPTFGNADARLLIVGLAPGLRGANRTGRPFTGDYAGDLLYRTLGESGFATGAYDRRPDDDLRLIDCLIVNAVRCVPPQNKPLPAEIATCRVFLRSVMAAMPALHAVVALGRIAHESVLRAVEVKLVAAPFGHGRRHDIAGPTGPALTMFDSYHCSRYNTNTRVLTETMFREVFLDVRACLDRPAEAHAL